MWYDPSGIFICTNTINNSDHKRLIFILINVNSTLIFQYIYISKKLLWIFLEKLQDECMITILNYKRFCKNNKKITLTLYGTSNNKLIKRFLSFGIMNEYDRPWAGTKHFKWFSNSRINLHLLKIGSQNNFTKNVFNYFKNNFKRAITPAAADPTNKSQNPKSSFPPFAFDCVKF